MANIDSIPVPEKMARVKCLGETAKRDSLSCNHHCDMSVRSFCFKSGCGKILWCEVVKRNCFVLVGF